MSEKLDLFEITVKRGLENFELPLDPNAWSEFEQVLDKGRTPVMAPPAGSGVGFLPKFGIAAAFLLGSLVFINQSVNDSSDLHEEALAEQHETVSGHSSSDNDSDNTSAILSQTTDETVDNLSDSNNEDSANETAEELTSSEENAVETASEETSNELTQAEIERIERINKRLQEKADEANEEKTSSDENENTKRHTTRYVGEDFNLGAVKNFTPNNDGSNDYFMPSRLNEGDLFLMTITNAAGATIFTSSDVDSPWNGTDSTGAPVDEGRYAWEVILQKDSKKEIFKGTVRLER